MKKRPDHKSNQGRESYSVDFSSNHPTEPTGPAPDMHQAEAFLNALDPFALQWCFQTFDDGPEKRGHLASTQRGTWLELAPRLQTLNAQGAGVFVTVNEVAPGKPRKAENIKRVRAVFADFDDASRDNLAALQCVALEPSILVESSPGKLHAYWLVNDMEPKDFTPLQQAIAEKLGTDSKVKDLPRVMRVPGFIHKKGAPELVKLLPASDKTYTMAELQAAFAPAQQPAPQPPIFTPLESDLNAPTAAPRREHDRYTQRAIERATNAVFSAGSGERNDTLNATTYGLARLAAAGRLDWGQESQKLERAAIAAGLAPAEIRATLKSARDAGNTDPNFDGMPRDNGQTLQQRDIDADTGELREGSGQEAQEPRLKPVDVAQVLTDPDDPPRFVWGQYLPRGVVSMLGAHGGTGKSTIALMLAVAVASGRGELFGQPCDQGRAVFVSLEDGPTIVRHRLATICKEWNIAPELLVNRLTIADGTDWPELFSADRDDGQVTPTYRELRNLAQGADLVLIDNASDGFGGDEIKRRQVRAFVRSLGAIAKAENAALLLLAHVDKSTSKKLNQDSEGYSGSTAWHNSVRSRLFMERVSDGGLRIAHQKANLGQTAELLNLVWPKDGLPEVAHTMAPEGLVFANEQHTKNLLRLIAEFGERGEHVTSATTSRTNAAKLLGQEPSYPKSLKPAEVFDLLRRAERAGYLEKGQRRTPHRKVLEVWELTAQGRGFAGLAPTAPTAPTYDIDEVGAQGAMGAPTAPTCVGGMGERARAQVGAQVGATPHTLAPEPTDCADFKNDYASATQGW